MRTVLQPNDWQAAVLPLSAEPSGGEILRAMGYEAAPPSGSERGYLASALQGGLVVGMIMACGTATANAQNSGVGVRSAPSAPGVGSMTVAFTRRESNRPSVSTAEQINVVQQVFGLTVSQLSSVLRVSRPTLYAWMDGDTPSPRSRDAAARLGELHAWALHWQAAVGRTIGHYLAIPAAGASSLLDLLTNPEWDRETMESALNGLRERAVEDRARIAALQTADSVERERLQTGRALRRARGLRR